jgi:hypothetical protein
VEEASPRMFRRLKMRPLRCSTVKNFIICTPRQCYLCSNITEDGIGGSCGTLGGEKKCIQGFGEGL